MKTLELNQMEKFNGGCNVLVDGLTGASVVIGFSSWWTGAGAGVAFGLSLLSIAADSYYCHE